MVLRIAIAVLVGGGVGLAVGLAGRNLGGQCPLTCNPYVSTGLGVIIALMLASTASSVQATPRSANLVSLDSEAQYRDAVSGEGKAALVEFFTPQCPACARQLPARNALADRFAGRATIATVNAHALANLAQREGVGAVPTMLIFPDGRRLETFVGVTAEEKLAELLEKHLPEKAGARQ